MKQFGYFYFCLLLLFSAVSGAAFAQQKDITIDDCFEQYTFFPNSGPDFRLMKDGRHYTLSEKGNIVRYDFLTRQQDSVLLEFSDLKLKYDDYSFSEDEQLILFRTNTKPVYRHSVTADYHVFDLHTRKLSRVNDAGQQAQFVALSPDNRHAAFVMGNNVYLRNLGDGLLSQVTDDGRMNEIINGLPDWVYEEEFSPVSGEGMTALVWNTDGARFAFLQFDERAVPEMPLTWYEGGTYPRESKFKYPKVGAPNAVVNLKIYDLENGTLAGCPDIKAHEDDYLVRLNWVSKFNLVVTCLNRMQDTLDLILLTPERLKKDLAFSTELLLRETDTAYVEVHDNLRFMEEKEQYIWTSERSGFNHIYLYDFINGNMLRPLTSGNFDVTAFYGVDEKNNTFYYQTATPTPLDRQIWEGDLNGGPSRLITPGKGTYSVDFTPTFDHFTLQWSDANTPAVATLCDRSGKILYALEENKDLVELRKTYRFVPKTFFDFTTPDGVTLNGWMMKPDSMVAGKKYPVLIDIYGGPGSQTVQNQYDGYTGTWHQLLVQKGYIIVSVDNRGTGARGRDFKKCTQLELGHYETEDQISAARYLGTLPFVDAARIGIWGWSFGGYLSTSCILKGNDVFKMAMAVAPVTNWKWYDSAYTERYMHTTTDNNKGYEDNSPLNFAGSLKGNYLICHGIADDNVHWQQTTEMINTLIKAGKDFETYYYPNCNHGIYSDNATRHLFTKLTNFITNKL
jgi:dipeptidyl-peptidase-4